MASSPAPSMATSQSEMMLTELPIATPARPRSNDDEESRLVTKEKTPNSLVLKLRLPPQRLRDLVFFNEGSASVSIQSSPPPSSPIASTSAVDTKPTAKRKSGPKPKKTKIVIGEDGKPVEVLAVSLAGPRLGPKSNAGAINENLRNLDRSGKSCRRWHKKSVVVRSLYGAKWKAAGWIGEADA